MSDRLLLRRILRRLGCIKKPLAVRTEPGETPQGRRWNPDRPWQVLAALAGGVWGALLARVLGELLPLSLLPGMGCWILTPFPVLILALTGAFVVPLALRARKPVAGKASSGRATYVRSWPLVLGMAYLLQPYVRPLWGAWLLVSGLGGVAWLCRQEHPHRVKAGWLWDVLAFVLPLALYISTLAPSVLPGDSGEFQFVASVLGIPHPTGYPLYLVLGKAFSLLPIRSVAYRLNLLSAVAAAGAVWATYRAARSLGLRRFPSLIGAALLAVSETFWSQATIAEKYTLNAFFAALTLWLGLQWRRERLAGRTGSRWLSAWALCYGLSLTHHRTMLLFAPSFLWLLWTTNRSCLRPRSALRLASLILGPLLLYLLLPLLSAASPPYAYMRVDSIKTFLDLVLARTYQGSLFQGGWAAVPGRLAAFSGLLVRQFGPLGLAATVAGWFVLARRNRVAAWSLVAGVAIQIAFALNYYVPNTFVYYLPAYVWLSVCAGVVVDAVLPLAEHLPIYPGAPKSLSALRRAAARLQPSLAPHLRVAWLLLAGVLPVYLCAARWTAMDQRRSYAYQAFDHTYGQMALRSVEPDALVVSDWMPATVLWYALLVEDANPTTQLAVVDPLEGQWSGVVDAALAAGRPVYLARPLMAASERYALASAGPLVRVLSGPTNQPPSRSHPLRVDLEDGIRLLGAHLSASGPGFEGAIRRTSMDPVKGGSVLHVTVFWQAARSPAGDHAVALRLASATGHILAQHQSRHPVGGTYPTSRWVPGQVVADYYSLSLPPYLPSGEYSLQVTIGPSFAENGLRDSEGVDRQQLAKLSVRKPDRWAGPTQFSPVRTSFGNGLALIGYDAPQEVAAGERVSLSLLWLVCNSMPAGDDSGMLTRSSLALVRRGNRKILLTPQPGPAQDWHQGAWVAEHYTFTVPEDLVRIEVRPVEPSARPAFRYRLPVRLTSAPPPVANFGSMIHLRAYTYESERMHPGDTVHLTLEWEAARVVDEAYKVFVHILGQNGLPVAQQDNEPVNGTRPTNRWQGGERVSDPYSIALPADLAPGRYRVEVGLYRISDLTRLPVLDEDLSVVDDKMYLAPLVVDPP